MALATHIVDWGRRAWARHLLLFVELERISLHYDVGVGHNASRGIKVPELAVPARRPPDTIAAAMLA